MSTSQTLQMLRNALSATFSLTIVALCALLWLGSCSKPKAGGASNHAVYHWKSHFTIHDADSTFMAKHDVGRIYLRLFDIQYDPFRNIIPTADVHFYGNISPEIEVVPTVFITTEVLRQRLFANSLYANYLYDRIKNMLANYNITNVPEIQIDCDWTEHTASEFFTFCKELKKLVNADNRLLSATIRLHQLSQEAPPVDRGVLMVYNVGDLKDINETNSILSAKVVKSYTTKAPKYALPLDVAYPAFGWGVVFENSYFSRLVTINNNPDSIPSLTNLHDNWYKCTPSDNNWDNLIATNEVVRYERPSVSEILKAKGYVEDYLGYHPQHIILYHLDEEQLSNYSDEDIKKIYQ